MPFDGTCDLERPAAPEAPSLGVGDTAHGSSSSVLSFICPTILRIQTMPLMQDFAVPKMVLRYPW